jgi:hypothetical protein
VSGMDFGSVRDTFVKAENEKMKSFCEKCTHG